MPHGRLTPLGRQLRSVLSSLSRPAPSPVPFHCSHARNGADLRLLHAAPVTTASSAASAVPSVEYEPLRQEQHEEDPASTRRFRQTSWRILKRRRRTDHATEALKDVGRDRAVAHPPKRELDLSYVNPQSYTMLKDLRTRRQRHQHDHVPLSAESRELSLQRILASYIRHKGKAEDYLAAEWESAFRLSGLETDYLQHKGFGLEDVAVWAEIATDEDPMSAVEALARRTDKAGAECVPMFMYLHLARRDFLSARALRLLLRCVSALYGSRVQHLKDPNIDTKPLFTIIVRLLRHAREVWPQAMPVIADLLLRHFRSMKANRSLGAKQVSQDNFLLNKLMGLVSFATAARPFKDVHHQESTIVSILRYMAEHDPPLHIDRQGYRAVIRVQLRQRKTDNDRLWAELKALSWPPWKVDRTAMDSNVGLSYGVSRANSTLVRMREAGYAPLYWERTAQLYTGWDVDRTPTIQLRALLERQPYPASNSTKIPWAARIESTRTIQEAWACYLAWEDEQLPHDQHVYFAILKKLNAHENPASKRTIGTNAAFGRPPGWPLLPGDHLQMSPLPPSTHLYTYTRVPPPSVQDFYSTLQGRGVVFDPHSLALLVDDAHTIQAGIQRLRDHDVHYPEVEGLLTLDPSFRVADLPLPIFAAAVRKYANFATTSLLKVFPDDRLERFRIDSADPLIPNHELNPHSSVARAIELLRTWPIAYRPLWNAVFEGLTRKKSLPYLRLVVKSPGQIFHDEKKLSSPEIQRAAGTLTAYQLMRGVLELSHKNGLDLDDHGFINMCQCTAYMVDSLWTALQSDEKDEHASENDSRQSASDQLKGEAQWWPGRMPAARLIHNQFKALVGHDSTATMSPQQTTPDGVSYAQMPELLTVPSAAVLHAYIRALGWLADYNGICDTLRWMHKFRSELAERQAEDRQGHNIMRQVMIATRVFLERSWLHSESDKDGEDTDRYRPEIEQRHQQERKGAGRNSILGQIRNEASQKIIVAARAEVDEMEEWGGWPTDEEVKAYVHHGWSQEAKGKSS